MDETAKLQAEATSGVERRRKKRRKDKKKKRRHGTEKVEKAPVSVPAATPVAKSTESKVSRSVPAMECTAVALDDLLTLPSTVSKSEDPPKRSVRFTGVPSKETSPKREAPLSSPGPQLTISIMCSSPDDLLQEMSDFSEPVAVAERAALGASGGSVGKRESALSFISLRRLLLPRTPRKRVAPTESSRSLATLPPTPTDARGNAPDTAKRSSLQTSQAGTATDIKSHRRTDHTAEQLRIPVLGKPDLGAEAESIYPMIFSGDATNPPSVAHTEYVTSVILKEAIFITESSLHGLVLTVLHCLSGAIASILTKRLKLVPKSKIAFYIALMSLCAGMPGAMTMKKPFAPVELQPVLVLRSCLGTMSIMCKAMALVYIHVSEVVVISALIPIGVSIGSWLFLHERINRLQWLSMGMTVLGVAIVMRPLGRQSLNVEHLTGILFSLGAVLAVIQLYVVVRYVRYLTVRKYGFNGSCCSVALSVLISIVTGTFSKLLSGRLLATLIMMSQVNFCAIVFVNKALEMESAAVVTTFKFCGDIILSMVLEAVFLDTYPDTWGCVGSAVIVLSVLVMGFEKMTHLYGRQMSPLMQLLGSSRWSMFDWLWRRVTQRDEYCTNL